jgi:hypothetical protein
MVVSIVNTERPQVVGWVKRIFICAILLIAVARNFSVRLRGYDTFTFHRELDQPSTSATTSTTTTSTAKGIQDDEYTVKKRLKKDYSIPNKYWGYDEAAPPIVYAKTHLLTSLPRRYRLEDSAFENITEYLSRPEHQYPQKLHVFETNPSITALPAKYYRQPFTFDSPLFSTAAATTAAARSRNATTGVPLLPVYLSSYRITHEHNCMAARHIMYGGGDWNVAKRVPQTDYLGLALLSEDLSILADVVVSFADTPALLESINGKVYQDYRLFTLLSGGSASDGSDDDQEEDLYLAVFITIRKLRLGPPRGDPILEADPSFIRLRHLGERDDANSTSFLPQFSVYLHRSPACPESYAKSELGSKNLLYFQNTRRPRQTANDNTNHTNTTTTNVTTTTTMVEYWPGGNPNDVRKVDLDQTCETSVKTRPNRTSDGSSDGRNTDIVPSFRNYHDEKYHHINRFLTVDRGSACCVKLSKKSTLPSLQKRHAGIESNHTLRKLMEENDHPSHDFYFVGVSHPKTPYPGKHLPDGVLPNIYLSRFFAMEASPPHNIVARSGAFCFGYPSSTEEEEVMMASSSSSPLRLWNTRNMPMRFHNQSFDCPRIHFVLSIVEETRLAEKWPWRQQQQQQQQQRDDRRSNKDPEDNDEDRVVISYGVSDCSSRFVKVNKADIRAMLWPEDGDSVGANDE